MTNNTNNDKEMATLFYDMYLGCLKFKQQKNEEKSNNKITCDDYYDKFKFFNEKYMNSKINN